MDYDQALLYACNKRNVRPAIYNDKRLYERPIPDAVHRMICRPLGGPLPSPLPDHPQDPQDDLLSDPLADEQDFNGILGNLVETTNHEITPNHMTNSRAF